MVNAALNAVFKCASLVVAADEKENLLGIANCSNTNRKSGLGNLVGIVVKETGVDDQGVLGQSADTGARSQGGEGLVEGDVAVHAAAAQEQINAAVGSDLVLITLALGFQILGHAVENVHIFGRNVDMVEEIIMHEVPVALVMLSGQANILVHVEGDHVLEGHFPGLVHLDQALIDTQRRRTGRQTQNKGTVFLVVVDGVGDVLCSPFTHSVVVVFDDKFHCFTPLQTQIL